MVQIFSKRSYEMIMAMLFTALVLADNIQDDVAASGIVTITAGDDTTVNYWIVATGKQDNDVNGCNVDSTHTATLTINVPLGADVTVDPASLTFADCAQGNDKHKQAVTFTSDTAGDYDITVSMSGGIAGSQWNTNSVAFTLHVDPATTVNTPPTLDLPADIVAEAADASGAAVYYTATASDAHVQCDGARHHCTNRKSLR
jgi:hypothetical protein